MIARPANLLFDFFFGTNLESILGVEGVHRAGEFT